MSVSSNKWEPPQHEPRVGEPMSVSKPPSDDEPMWIMDKLKAEQEPVRHAPIPDTNQLETNNNEVKQVSTGEGCFIMGKIVRFIYLYFWVSVWNFLVWEEMKTDLHISLFFSWLSKEELQNLRVFCHKTLHTWDWNNKVWFVSFLRNLKVRAAARRRKSRPSLH